MSTRSLVVSFSASLFSSGILVNKNFSTRRKSTLYRLILLGQLTERHAKTPFFDRPNQHPYPNELIVDGWDVQLTTWLQHQAAFLKRMGHLCTVSESNFEMKIDVFVLWEQCLFSEGFTFYQDESICSQDTSETKYSTV